jgi:hypothetical protein
MWNTFLMKFLLSFVWLLHIICHDLSHTWQDNRMILFVLCYSRVTSISTPTFCMPVVSSSLTMVTAHLLHSHDRSCYVSRPILTHPPHRLSKHVHTISRTIPACNMSLISRTLPSPQVGKFMELIVLYTKKNGFGGLVGACWPLVPKFAGSNLAEAVGFLRAKKTLACLSSEGKKSRLSHVVDLWHVKDL